LEIFLASATSAARLIIVGIVIIAPALSRRARQSIGRPPAIREDHAGLAELSPFGEQAVSALLRSGAPRRQKRRDAIYVRKRLLVELGLKTKPLSGKDK
jgi:hypothetical protein